MAARKSPRLSPQHRQAIRTSMLIKRLQDFVLLDPEQLPENQRWRCYMTASQIKAAEILLRKTLPDLSAVEIGGEVRESYIVRAPAMVENWDRWGKTYGPNTKQ